MTILPAALIFDLDGVVADTEPAHQASWRALASEHGLTFGDREASAVRGRTREDSLSVLLAGRPLPAHERAAWLAHKQAHFIRALGQMGPDQILPGVRDLLGEARTAGIPCGLASSSRNAHAVLDRLDLLPFFAFVADGASVPRAKPDPAIFLLVAEMLAVPPARTIVLEDSTAGVAAARAGGFRVIALGPTVATVRANRHLADLAGMRLMDLTHGA